MKEAIIKAVVKFPDGHDLQEGADDFLYSQFRYGTSGAFVVSAEFLENEEYGERKEGEAA